MGERNLAMTRRDHRRCRAWPLPLLLALGLYMEQLLMAGEGGGGSSGLTFVDGKVPGLFLERPRRTGVWRTFSGKFTL